MLLVLTANNALVFMIVWGDDDVSLVLPSLSVSMKMRLTGKAGFVYIIMAHVGFRISCRCLFHYVC